MPPLIEFRHITKRFGGVTALEDVSLAVEAGTCHALIGENGAGKSTLGRVLAGIHRPDAGEIRLAGTACVFRSPADAARAGIGMVHQELAFCPDLSVAENLCLGHWPRRGRFFVDRRSLHARAAELLGQIGVRLDLRQPLRCLSTAQEQLVQIAAAVGTGARVLIFDEPTSSLADAEAEQLFGLIGRLKARGVTMIYVSHRLPEVFRLTDRVSVLRDGRHVETLPTAATDEAALVRRMIGRDLRALFAEAPAPVAAAGPPRLAVRHLSLPPRVRDVSLTVQAGEIVGLAGLVGAGRSELARAVFGLDRQTAGTVAIDGRALPPGRPRAALRAGLGFVPEDRKRAGLVLGLGGRANFALPSFDLFARLGWMLRRRERSAAAAQFARLNVKTPSLETPVAQLSGGNQQKVVLAKWLARPLRALILDEPTRGVDIGTKAAIHGLIRELAAGGLAVLLISSELPELLHLSHRIVVLRDGRVAGEVPRAAATQERVLALMAGLTAPA